MIEAKQALLVALSEAIQEVSPGATVPAAFESPKQAAHDKQDTKEGKKHVGVVKRHKKAVATPEQKDAKKDAAADTTAPAPTK